LIPHVSRVCLMEEVRSSAQERLLACIYAEDVVRAYVEAAGAPEVEGRTINIGSGVLTPCATLCDCSSPRSGRPRDVRCFGTLPVRPLEQEVRVDIEETARVPCWRARTPLEDGLRATVAWFRDHPAPRRLVR
jgi:UDP-glucose 4-epimerase